MRCRGIPLEANEGVEGDSKPPSEFVYEKQARFTLQLDEAVSHGVARQFGGGTQSELVHDVAALTFDSLDTNADRGSDLLVAKALCRQYNHVTFTLVRLDGMGWQGTQIMYRVLQQDL